MRALFKLEDARMWASILIGLGILCFVVTVVIWRTGTGAWRFYQNNLILPLHFTVLGIIFIVTGITVQKMCKNITQMMTTYDEEIHLKLKAIGEKIETIQKRT